MRPDLQRDYTYLCAFLLICGYLEYLCGGFIFPLGVVLAVGFARWRKELYLLWTTLSPRITGKYVQTPNKPIFDSDTF
jgi:hypothetical protein